MPHLGLEPREKNASYFFLLCCACCLVWAKCRLFQTGDSGGRPVLTCVCVCVWTCVNVCERVWTSVWTCVNVCERVWKCVNVCVNVCERVCEHVCEHVNVCVNVCVNMWTCVWTCVNVCELVSSACTAQRKHVPGTHASEKNIWANPSGEPLRCPWGRQNRQNHDKVFKKNTSDSVEVV